ncbi:MAG TPA: hypothetical protein VH684_04355 [Xanthobacteraceae bacterium]|jgi:hypothetical protein
MATKSVRGTRDNIPPLAKDHDLLLACAVAALGIAASVGFALAATASVDVGALVAQFAG